MILDELRSRLAREMDMDVQQINEKTQFLKHLKMDSLDFVAFVMAIEREFQVDIPDHELEQICTVADLARCIEQGKS